MENFNELIELLEVGVNESIAEDLTGVSISDLSFEQIMTLKKARAKHYIKIHKILLDMATGNEFTPPDFRAVKLLDSKVEINAEKLQKEIVTELLAFIQEHDPDTHRRLKTLLETYA